jgi:hypothetical protein
VIVNNLYFRWPKRSSRPFKTNPPLIVDANAELSFPIASQGFKSVARKRGEVPDRNSSIQPVKLQPGRSFESRKHWNPLPASEIPSSLVAIAKNHSSRPYQYLLVTSSVKIEPGFGLSGAQAPGAPEPALSEAEGFAPRRWVLTWDANRTFLKRKSGHPERRWGSPCSISPPRLRKTFSMRHHSARRFCGVLLQKLASIPPKVFIPQ